MKQTVTVRNLTIGSGLPKICVPIVAENEAQLKTQLEQIARVPADLIEFRADFYEDTDDEEKLRKALAAIRKSIGGRPLLFTFRTKEEGGRRKIGHNDYLRLNAAAASLAAEGLTDLVDVELFTLMHQESVVPGAYIRELQKTGVKVIASSHDFEKTPDTQEMLSRLCTMQNIGADITKLAVMPQSRRDVVRLLEVAVLMEEQYGDRPCITMSMGRSGAISRVSGAFTGSAVTFASAGNSSAPGQIEAGLLAEILQKDLF